MANGYAGRFLRVDLTNGRCSPFMVEDDRLRKFIGGSSLGAKLFLDDYPLDADPLAPESPLMVMTGPMVGSGFPGTSRFAVCAKSPLTGIWGESACGGNFGPELKKAGYDGIVITGRAEKPVVLSIFSRRRTRGPKRSSSAPPERTLSGSPRSGTTRATLSAGRALGPSWGRNG